MCSFEWIGLHFKAIFRRLAGFERPENSPVDCFQRERVGRPRRQVKGNQRRNAGTAVNPKGLPVSACADCVVSIRRIGTMHLRRRKCIFPNLETDSRVCFKMQGDAISSGFACISRRFSAGLVGLSQGKSTQKCRQRRRNCASGILETHSKEIPHNWVVVWRGEF